MLATAQMRDLLARIRVEYREMPGLCLTLSQARRLWNVDAATCALALTTLAQRGMLKRTPAGGYVRGPLC